MQAPVAQAEAPAPAVQPRLAGVPAAKPRPAERPCRRWPEPWDCPHCTLRNEPWAMACDACEAPRPPPMPLVGGAVEDSQGEISYLGFDTPDDAAEDEVREQRPARLFPAPAFGEEEADDDDKSEGPVEFLAREEEVVVVEDPGYEHLALDSGGPSSQEVEARLAGERWWRQQQQHLVQEQPPEPPQEFVDPPWVLQAPAFAQDMKRAPPVIPDPLDGACYAEAVDGGRRIFVPEQPPRPEPQGLPPSALTFADIQAAADPGGRGGWADLSSVAPPEQAVYHQPRQLQVDPDVFQAQLAAQHWASDRWPVAADGGPAQNGGAAGGLGSAFHGGAPGGVPGCGIPGATQRPSPLGVYGCPPGGPAQWPADAGAAPCAGRAMCPGGAPAGWQPGLVQAPPSGPWPPQQPRFAGAGPQAVPAPQPYACGHAQHVSPEAASHLAARLDSVIGRLERSAHPGAVLGDLREIEASYNAVARRC